MSNCNRATPCAARPALATGTRRDRSSQHGRATPGANSVLVPPSEFAMSLARASSLLRRLVSRQPVLKDDPADMGTAFGLEASLGPVSTHPAEDGARTDCPANADDWPMAWLARRFRRHA